MGHVIISGGSRMTVPITGTRAGDLAVGTVVKLNEGGTNVDFLVVNQGIPSNSSLYDSSCDGTWLLRKNVKVGRAYDNNGSNAYANSSVNTWLNSDYFNTLGIIEQSGIRQVKIPYCVGSGASTVNSGSNGLSAKIFLLSLREVGTDTVSSSYSNDGASVNYFSDGLTNKRMAYKDSDNSSSQWWLRSPVVGTNGKVMYINSQGGEQSDTVDYSFGIRPALILPKTAIFDFDTLVLKGG